MGEFISNLLLVFIHILFQMILNWIQEGDGSSVGSVMIYFGSILEVCTREQGYNRGAPPQDTIVVPGGPGSSSQGNLGEEISWEARAKQERRKTNREWVWEWEQGIVGRWGTAGYSGTETGNSQVVGGDVMIELGTDIGQKDGCQRIRGWHRQLSTNTGI